MNTFYMQKLLIIILSLWALNGEAKSLVGLHAEVIELNERLPLGGYGTAARRAWPFLWNVEGKPHLRLFKNALGSLDDIRAKAMVIKTNQTRLVFVSLDIIGVPAEFYDDLSFRLARYGFEPKHLFISGTHTHSGPGGLSQNTFWQIFAMDRFNKKFYEHFSEIVVNTVLSAEKKATEAQLFEHAYNTQGLQRNRRAGDRPLDPSVNLLMAKDVNGKWLGGIINFAVHGVSLDDKNRYFSADAPGAIERVGEAFLHDMNQTLPLFFEASETPVVLFINGAEGDVSPTHSGEGGKEQMGQEFGLQMQAAWSGLKPLTPTISVKQKRIRLGVPQVKIDNCAHYEWLPKSLRLPIRKFFAEETTLWQISLGPILMMTWPGEATTELGLKLKALAPKQKPWVLGLTNDHLAYFTTEDEFKTGGYEACVNLYGETGGARIIKGHAELLLK